jgi:hypothetical protein
MSARKQRSDRAGRPAMRSPGRPTAGRREHRQRFWEAIARGRVSEDAAAEAGVSAVVGVRWFREGGGMPTVTMAALSGAVPVVQRAGGDHSPARAGLRRAGDRAAVGSLCVVGLARAAAQRRDSQRRA